MPLHRRRNPVKTILKNAPGAGDIDALEPPALIARLDRALADSRAALGHWLEAADATA